jgi:hypothetical protein
MPSPTGRHARLLVCVLAVALTACSAGEPDGQAASIEPGVCVSGEAKDQGALVPDWSTVVECGTPHAYEVYDIIDLPQAALTGTTRQERADNRDDLALPLELTEDSEQRLAFEEFARRACGTSLQRVTGYDEIILRGASAEDAQVVPALRGISAPWISVMPEDEWSEGRRQVVCSARFEVADHTDPGRVPVDPRASTDDRMIITRAGTESLPIRFRSCRTYEADRRSISDTSSCGGAHVDEALFFFQADGVFDEKFVSGLVERPTRKKLNRFDDVCQEALPQVLGDYDTDSMRGFGSGVGEWTETNRAIRCSVGPVEFREADLVPGSLVRLGPE